MPSNVLTQQLGIGLNVNDAGAQQKLVVVIRGDALKKPQQLGMYGLAQIWRDHDIGLEAFHIPAMKILMAA